MAIDTFFRVKTVFPFPLSMGQIIGSLLTIGTEQVLYITCNALFLMEMLTQQGKNCKNEPFFL